MISKTKIKKGVQLDSEILPGMKITCRVRERSQSAAEFEFDGTPVGEFIRLSDVAVWMNAMRAMIEAAKEEIAQL